MMVSTLLAKLAVSAEIEERKALLRPAPPWSDAERAPEAVAARLLAADGDFWAFDRAYFPPEVYTQGYAPPGDYHRHLVEEALRPGVYVHLGARVHGKTVTAKKLEAWALLTGRTEIGGTLSQKLQVSRAILADVAMLIRENPRIAHDYRPRFVVANSDQLQLTTEVEDPAALPEGTRRRMARWRFYTAFSEGRSVRGYARGFARPTRLLCDDLETRKSPMGEEQVTGRIKFLQESAKSMGEGGTLVALGNDFDERCAMHRLRLECEGGLLAPSWRVERHPAWDDERGPLWRERFPVESEAEAREAMEPADEDEWQGEFLQNPQPPTGTVFERGRVQFAGTANRLPPDARGVLYVDPNLAKKGKGDTTAVTAVLYSAREDRYFAVALACRSFSDSNALLDAVLEGRGVLAGRVRTVGFDGHVSQESTWSQHVRNYCRLKGQPYPSITWCRYKVDELAKNASQPLAERAPDGEPRLLFLRECPEEEGRRYPAQVVSFSGKKSNRADDAPDSLVCGHELLHERGLGRRASGDVAVTVRRQPGISF